MLLLNLDIIFTDDSNSKVNKEVHGINGADMVARFMFPQPAATAWCSLPSISWHWSTVNWSPTPKVTPTSMAIGRWLRGSPR